MLIDLSCCLCLFFGEHCLISVLAVLQFTQPYQGESIMGILGSSVNFTWQFTGDPSVVHMSLNQISVFFLWIEGVPKRL